MITLIQKQNIVIKGHIEGKSARKISRELNIDKKTVGKYIKEQVRIFTFVLIAEVPWRLLLAF